MIRASLALLAALLIALPAAAQRMEDPILVPEISQHDIVLRQGFTGANLLLYGAVLDPSGQRAEEPYDIIIVLKGPSEQIRIREKQRLGVGAFGIWVNADNTSYRSVPSYYALASSRPVSDIVEENTAAIYELGLDYLQLSPIGAIDPEEQARFSAGLVDMRRREGLYLQLENAVTVTEGVLYSARLTIPSNVRPGLYTAETFAIANGQVIDSAPAYVQVRKEGFERRVEEESERNPFLYGLFAVALSVFMGWVAGRLFAMV